MVGGMNLGAAIVDIVDGQSPLMQTDDSARMIMLLGKDSKEVHREVIKLRAGSVNEIRL